MDVASGVITFIRWTVLGAGAVLALIVIASLMIPARAAVTPQPPLSKR
jgi:hypothetical protein